MEVKLQVEMFPMETNRSVCQIHFLTELALILVFNSDYLLKF